MHRFDDPLNTPIPPSVTVFGYADDKTLLIDTSSRVVFESKIDLTLATEHEWATQSKFQIYVEKTEAIVFKGPHKNNPVLRTDEARVNVVAQTKYLNVVIIYTNVGIIKTLKKRTVIQ